MPQSTGPSWYNRSEQEVSNAFVVDTSDQTAIYPGGLYSALSTPIWFFRPPGTAAIASCVLGQAFIGQGTCGYKITSHDSEPDRTEPLITLREDTAKLFDRQDESKHTCIDTDHSQAADMIKAIYSHADAQLADLARSKASEGWVCFGLKANIAQDGSWMVPRPVAFRAGAEESLSGNTTDHSAPLPINLDASFESEWNPQRGTLRVARKNGQQYSFTTLDGSIIVTKPVLEVWSENPSTNALEATTRILASYTGKLDPLNTQHVETINWVFGPEDGWVPYEAFDQVIASTAHRGDVTASFEALEVRTAGSFDASKAILAEVGWKAEVIRHGVLLSEFCRL